jgi:hypothetical protein
LGGYLRFSNHIKLRILLIQKRFSNLNCSYITKLFVSFYQFLWDVIVYATSLLTPSNTFLSSGCCKDVFLLFVEYLNASVLCLLSHGCISIVFLDKFQSNGLFFVPQHFIPLLHLVYILDLNSALFPIQCTLYVFLWNKMFTKNF